MGPMASLQDHMDHQLHMGQTVKKWGILSPQGFCVFVCLYKTPGVGAHLLKRPRGSVMQVTAKCVWAPQSPDPSFSQIPMDDSRIWGASTVDGASENAQGKHAEGQVLSVCLNLL